MVDRRFYQLIHSPLSKPHHALEIQNVILKSSMSKIFSPYAYVWLQACGLLDKISVVLPVKAEGVKGCKYQWSITSRELHATWLAWAALGHFIIAVPVSSQHSGHATREGGRHCIARHFYIEFWLLKSHRQPVISGLQHWIHLGHYRVAV